MRVALLVEATHCVVHIIHIFYNLLNTNSMATIASTLLSDLPPGNCNIVELLPSFIMFITLEPTETFLRTTSGIQIPTLLNQPAFNPSPHLHFARLR